METAFAHRDGAWTWTAWTCNWFGTRRQRGPMPHGEGTPWTCQNPRVTLVEDLVLRSKPLGKRRPGEQATLGWSAPVLSVDTALLQVLLDSVAVPAQVNQRMPSMEFVLTGAGLAQPGAQVELTMLPGCLQRPGSDEILPTDTLELAWSVLKEEELGSWSLKCDGCGLSRAA